MYFGYRFEVPPLQIAQPYEKIAVCPQYFPLRSIKKDQEERTKLSYFKLLEAKKTLFAERDNFALTRVRNYYGQLEDRFSLAHETASKYFNKNEQQKKKVDKKMQDEDSFSENDEQLTKQKEEQRKKLKEGFLNNFYLELYDKVDETITKYDKQDDY